MNLFLYGPPGSGKSTVGKELARKLSTHHVDLDTEFERLYEVRIPDFIKHYGISVFRVLESQTLLSVIQNSRSRVISLGGGSLLDEENVRRIYRSKGRIISLSGPIGLLLERIMADTINVRPLAQNANDFRNLMHTRGMHYQSFNPRFPIEGRTPQEIASDILGFLL
ncbi:MAG: shikimate kinase [Candidatus Altimarinota bacterium]